MWDFYSVDGKLDEVKFEKFLVENFSSSKIIMVKTFYNNDLKNISD